VATARLPAGIHLQQLQRSVGQLLKRIQSSFEAQDRRLAPLAQIRADQFLRTRPDINVSEMLPEPIGCRNS
jgi:hypothetical protein